MTKAIYELQVELLLKVLPEIAKESCFALHGGTAINLFVREMPRLSVDIDLTYIPIEDRNTSLQNIFEALARLKANIERALPASFVQHQREISKLQISDHHAQIKIEVNQTNRGIYAPPQKLILCDIAQEKFDAFCDIPVVSMGQLYGGKLCAALDRQHPRDLFDVKLLLENEGFTDDIKKGFLLALLSSNRPIHELLNPNLSDQQQAFENQFDGMAMIPFTYKDYETTREVLIRTVNQCLNEADKQFLLSVKKLRPDWQIYDFEQFPSVQWKLQNLKKLRQRNLDKYQKLYENLEEHLFSKS
ncbi:nucleotidyl transferase AbiEii/AbiGii toxin family protein [Croceimicrobium hydrocarbonivorans]|uniref:Nucleotidyl transferase AbiEii/AbiGii toxin family protein n=1 Tax=Croceimicrobium hydrocarbonivorans TaxID=2761580 RepID=A0A7H0VF25_9FLAO|nr:nucleotidyl transferase AbiEii/AbiGii toxin family protein [Croceimicrobium hydrocarbonivorans]QNR24323.1 nucleotidyl transferase AbiEii/AbiGii toxin family protein [Croceimicrobium hydrocarbonivorans]